MFEKALITLRFKLQFKLVYFSSRAILTCYCLLLCTVAITTIIIISQAAGEKIFINKLEFGSTQSVYQNSDSNFHKYYL